jgi:hypothetical protein
MKKFVSRRDEKLEQRSKLADHVVKSDSTREWEHFPYDADVGIRVWGATAAEVNERSSFWLRQTVHRLNANCSL